MIRWAGMRFARVVVLAGIGAMALASGGCRSGAVMLKPQEQTPIDRRYIEYPAGTELVEVVRNLTAPTAMAFDADGSLLVAEGGIDGHPARVFGFKTSGEYFEIWPRGRRLPFSSAFEIRGPIGGIVAANGKVYVTHRDAQGMGAVTRFDYEGSKPLTIVHGLPAQGDSSVTDIAVGKDGRLFFGMGSATNSGVVGLDNLEWVRRNREFCDQPWTDESSTFLFLRGQRFDSVNPFASLFGGSDLTVTGPFQPFGKSIEARARRAANGKPNAAIYSCNPEGGDLQVEAYGIRYPAGLGFDEFGKLYFTNQGMKLRGTRPVQDDPDTLLKLAVKRWYGWPDYSANLLPIHSGKFQPPEDLIAKSGYQGVQFLIDHPLSGLRPLPAAGSVEYDALLAAEFRPLSGAAKFDFVPTSGPLSRLRQGRDLVIVAQNGDRAPFDTSGRKLDMELTKTGHLGFKVVAVRLERGAGQVENFIRNVGPGDAPLSWFTDKRPIGLERPQDVKFGPDGAMYILDMGQLEMEDAQPRIRSGTGRVFKLVGKDQK